MTPDEPFEPRDEEAPDAPPTNLDRERSRRGAPVPRGASWEASVVRYTSKEGEEKIAGSCGNLALYLVNEEGWSGCLGYNEFSEREIWLKSPPEMPGLACPKAGDEVKDEHDTYVQHWFHRARGFNVRSPNLGISTAARMNGIHPVRDYLKGLVWDGKVRLTTWLSYYFGATDNRYSAEIGARWAISAVARIMEPGCQVDSMLIIEGKQGKGKSTGLEALTGKDWFADTPLDIKDRADAFQALRGKWIYEIAELDAFRGHDVTRIKRFIGGRVDNYRASYAKRNRDYQRQTVFVGTTNEKHYLQDRTGNRRYWPFASTGTIRVQELARDRDQLWAEAVVRYSQRMAWHIDDAELQALAEAEQELRMIGDDPWVTLVSEWLSAPTIPTLDSKTERTIVNLQDGFTTTDVLLGSIGARRETIGKREETRIGLILNEMGFRSRRVTINNVRAWRYFSVTNVQDASEVGQQVGHE